MAARRRAKRGASSQHGAPTVAHIRPTTAQDLARGRWPRPASMQQSHGQRATRSWPARDGWSPPPMAAAGSMLQNIFFCFDFKIEIYAIMAQLWIQLAVSSQPLGLRNHNFELTHRIMVKRLATSPHDPLGITDSACKNQLVMVSVQYGPFNTYLPIRSTTIDSIGYPRTKASGESSTTKNRLLHASGPHPIPPPNDPN
ncbi:kinesin-13A-like [Dorcoceras hygrometricum]|uniref:Kinesin-13A-like n=1 Tax=Dorcoceras hygrometricum TaxID=472368 RepID=A0A2Z7CTZ6_9LAMI|nr:kinesin-13A-like [Dorcoceras hygrometricum]